MMTRLHILGRVLLFYLNQSLMLYLVPGSLVSRVAQNLLVAAR